MKIFFSAIFFWLVVIVLLAPFSKAEKIELPFGHNTIGIQHLPNIDPQAIAPGEEKLSKPALAFKRIVEQTGSFLTLVLGAVSAIMIFVAGYHLITAQSTISEAITKEKMSVVYILIGLTIFTLGANLVYNYIFVGQGSYFTDPRCLPPISPDCPATFLASKAANQIKQILNLFLNFAGAGAILLLTISGIRLVLNPGDEAGIETHKKSVAYTAIGIVIIGLSDTLVNNIVFPNAGYSGMSVQAFELQLSGLSKYILGFLGIAVFISFVISGVLMVINYGNEEIWGKIKTTMKNIIIGATVVFFAYTIVATLLTTILAVRQGTPY